MKSAIYWSAEGTWLAHKLSMLDLGAIDYAAAQEFAWAKGIEFVYRGQLPRERPKVKPTS